jgi:bifunctional UDP-N-acetylglucosamine pyrophosphorylase/glucosamine-1-phosphate N-acetyltransferase
MARAKNRVKSAVLLAAGAGTKAWPYNEVRNKCAFPIANVPAVRRLADQLIQQGVERLVVVVGHREASVRHALHDLSIPPVYLRQDLQGTAPAALAALHLFDDDAWVAYGDIVTAEENLTVLRERYEADPPPAAVLLAPLNREDGGNWICSGITGDGRLAGIQGHPRGGNWKIIRAW